MATITSSTTKVILATPSDWREWYQLIKSSAGYAKVWEYINPDTKPEDLPVLTEPEFPTPATVKGNAATYAQLSKDEQEELKEMRKEYRRLFKIYEKKTDALYEISKNIQGSIDRSHLYLLEDKLEPRDMLVSLRERLAPTEIVRERTLIAKYRKLQKITDDTDIDKWLRDWQTIFTQCKTANIPDVQGTRAVTDFLVAISKIDSSFADIQLDKVDELESKGKKTEIPTLYDILDIYERRRQLRSSEKKTSRQAFATFKGRPHDQDNQIKGKSNAEPQNNNLESDTKIPNKKTTEVKPRKRPNCHCGDKHYYNECPYINESIRTSNWKPNNRIQKNINDLL